MASFSISGSTALTTTRKTVASVTQPAAATALGQVHRVHLGSVGTPTDASIEWQIQRTSTLGTATTVTPVDEDDSGSTPTIIGKSNYTVEPTYVANTVLFDLGINQRSAYTIMLAPGREWRMQVTNNRGIGVGALHASFTSTANAVIAWVE
jgi:hypothetical protein